MTIIFNWLGVLMILVVGGAYWLLNRVLGAISKTTEHWFFGVGLLVVDVAFRLWRASLGKDKFSFLISESTGGAFFFLPVWILSLILFVTEITGADILVIGAATLGVLNLAYRLRQVQLDRSHPLKALVNPKLGTFLYIIPLWVLALGLLCLSFLSQRKY